MHATVFATIFSTAFATTALKGLAWIAFLLTLTLVESLAGRGTSPRAGSDPGATTPGRGGGPANRCGEASLARLSLTLVPTPPPSGDDRLGRMGLLRPGLGRPAPAERAWSGAEGWPDRPA